MSEIQSLEVFEASVSPKTTWLFLRVTASSGAVGVGEITYFGHEDGIRQHVDLMARVLQGFPIRRREAFLRDRLSRERGRVGQIVLSGLEQALVDIRARELGVSAMELIGGTRSDDVVCYANINRGTSDRSPEGYARRARHAITEGYDAIKIAPFDGVVATDLGSPEAAARIDTGIARAIAVREAVGPDVCINIDCHGRFNEVAAKALVRRLEPMSPFWIEEPMAETYGNRKAIRRVRSFANDRGIRLAGGESEFGLDGYRRLVECECLDVILPDIRMCGGVAEALRIGHYVTGAGIEFSLHNPVGPVLDAISLRTAAAAPALNMLERTFEEFEAQARLVSPHLHHPAASPLIDHDAPGWGVSLDEAAIAATAGNAGPADFHLVAGAGQYA